MRLRLLAAALLVAVGLGAVGVVVLLPGSAGGDADVITTAVVRATVSADVVATGTISARTSYGLGFGSPAQVALDGATAAAAAGSTPVVASVDVAVGDRVTSGQTLATADTSSLEVDLAIAQANLAVAEAQLLADQEGATDEARTSAQQAISQAQLALRSATSSRANGTEQNELSLAQAERAVAEAEANLADARAGPTEDDLASARDAVTQAEASLANAQKNLGYVQQQNAISLRQAQEAVDHAYERFVLDQNPGTDAEGSPLPIDQTQVAADQSAWESAQRNLETAQLNAAKSLDQAQQQVDSAQLSLASAQRTLASQSLPSTEAIAAAEQALVTAQDNLAATTLKIESSESQSDQQVSQAQLSLASARTSYSSQTAPNTAQQIASDAAQVAGAERTVAEAEQALALASLVSPIEGTVVEVNIQPGVAAAGGYAIVVQSAELKVTAEFAESDLPSLSIGQAATVDVAATGEALSGTVTSISPVASTSGASAVVSYAVVVAIEGSAGVVARSGMSADVSVTTASVADALAVPAIALQGAAGTYSVQIVDGAGVVETRSVEVGLVTSSLAEIRSGLAEGESVVVGSSSERTGTTTSTQTQGGGFELPIGGGLGPGGGFRP